MDLILRENSRLQTLSELQLADSLRIVADSDSEYHLRTISPEYAFHQRLLGVLCHIQFQLGGEFAPLSE